MEKMVYDKKYGMKESVWNALSPQVQASVASEVETYNQTQEKHNGLLCKFSSPVAKSDLLTIGNVLRDMLAVVVPDLLTDENTDTFSPEVYNSYCANVGAQFATIAHLLKTNSLQATIPTTIKDKSKSTRKETISSESLLSITLPSGVIEGLASKVGAKVNEYCKSKLSDAQLLADTDDTKPTLIKKFGVKVKNSGGKIISRTCDNNGKFTPRQVIVLCEQIGIPCENKGIAKK